MHFSKTPSLFIISLFAVLFLTPFTRADSRVSIAIPAFAKECVYYNLLDEEDTLIINYQVLYGGDFELDFEIISPKGDSIIKQTNEKYADFLLKTFGLGEYSFCFINPYNQFKKVEFAITLERDVSDQEKNTNKDTVVVENSISEISRNLIKIDKALNYLRAREWRNKSTVESTESRIVYLSIIIIVIAVGISLAQATVVQFLFSGRQKNLV